MMEKELAEKLLQAGSIEEVIEIVKAEGQESTPEQTEELLAKMKEEDLSLYDLDSVAGGFCGIETGYTGTRAHPQVKKV